MESVDDSTVFQSEAVMCLYEREEERGRCGCMLPPALLSEVFCSRSCASNATETKELTLGKRNPAAHKSPPAKRHKQQASGTGPPTASAPTHAQTGGAPTQQLSSNNGVPDVSWSASQAVEEAKRRVCCAQLQCTRQPWMVSVPWCHVHASRHFSGSGP